MEKKQVHLTAIRLLSEASMGLGLNPQTALMFKTLDIAELHVQHRRKEFKGRAELPPSCQSSVTKL